MCGIAGIIGPDRALVEQSLARMLRCQTHRGPDDEGIELIDLGGLTIGLGQRRLSIIDLSPAGHQPMVNRASGDVIVYNGELYNFQELRRPFEQKGQQFRGHSDTEVLLYGLGDQGPSFLEKTCGMYAVAYFDSLKKRLLLARDPMGIKPLYVAQAHGCLLFASEVRAVLASGLLPLRVDEQGLASALAYGCVQEPLTFFEGIEAFEPGSFQWIDLHPAAGSLRPAPVRRFWSFPAIDPSLDEREASERLRATLDVAVKEHLIADVPVGVFLSSGVDSTIIANIARRHTERLRTFTVGFSDQPDLTESSLARETAEMLGIDHTDVQVTGAEAQSWMIDWLNSLDQPSADGLNTYIISKAVRRHGIVVALSGLGGDELFCGYSNFEEIIQIKRGFDSLAWLPRPLRRAAFNARLLNRPASVRERGAEMGSSAGDTASLYLYKRRFKSDKRLHAHGLYARRLGLHPTFLPPEVFNDAREDGEDLPAAISRLESRFYMRNMLLRDSDTNAMAHSLEIRVPFLDRRMLDLAYAIPGSIRMPGGKGGKLLLKSAFDDLLHTKLKTQVKRGFVLPTRRWMVGPMRDLCENALGNLKSSGIMNSDHIDEVWHEFRTDPDQPMWASALMLVVLSTYLQTAKTWPSSAIGKETTQPLTFPKHARPQSAVV